MKIGRCFKCQIHFSNHQVSKFGCAVSYIDTYFKLFICLLFYLFFKPFVAPKKRKNSPLRIHQKGNYVYNNEASTMISATTMMPPSNSLFSKRREKRRGQEQPPTASRIEDVAWFQRRRLLLLQTVLPMPTLRKLQLLAN